MEISHGRFDNPPARRILSPSSPPGQIGILIRLAILAASLSGLGCPGAGQRGRTSGVDASGDHSSTDAGHAVVDGIRVADASDVVDVGLATDATDASGDCPDVLDAAVEFDGDGKGSIVRCFHPGDGKGGADTDAH